MKNKYLLIMFTMLLFSCKANVVNSKDIFASTYEACVTKATGIFPDMMDCAYQALVIADKSLNKVYQDLLKFENREVISRLKKAQANWVNFKESNCSVYEAFGGQNGDFLYADCLLKSTESRLKELQDIKKIMDFL